MAIRIPALGSCLSRMTSGERQLKERPQHTLDNGTLRWCNLPSRPKQSHPDFVVIHPQRQIPRANYLIVNRALQAIHD